MSKWFEDAGLIMGGTGLGAIIVALIQKPWTRGEQSALHANSSKDKSVGDAGMLTAMASTFTDVTDGMREEIVRLQVHAGDMRQQAVQFEADLRAALQRVEDLHRMLAEKDATINRLQQDLDRVRSERDIAQERVIQQEGEIRQLNMIIESKKRVVA